MTHAVAAKPDNDIMERVITAGDLARLSPDERTKYYFSVCDSMGLNPLTKPFELITLNGKMVLYATRAATDQLRSTRKVSLIIISRERLDDVYTVIARATTPDGRTDESTGSVNVLGLKGDNLANAYMKAETKAKRRVTLSIVGLGWLDESETDSIAGAKKETIELPKEVVSDVSPKPSNGPTTPSPIRAIQPTTTPAPQVATTTINAFENAKQQIIGREQLNKLNNLIAESKTWTSVKVGEYMKARFSKTRLGEFTSFQYAELVDAIMKFTPETAPMTKTPDAIQLKTGDFNFEETTS